VISGKNGLKPVVCGRQVYRNHEQIHRTDLPMAQTIATLDQFYVPWDIKNQRKVFASEARRSADFWRIRLYQPDANDRSIRQAQAKPLVYQVGKIFFSGVSDADCLAAFRS